MANHDLELVPGLLTTRTEVAAAYGGARFGGIEPAVDSGMVLVYSDPKVGELHGYTFDGQAEDDEHGPLYLYTGEGKTGKQEFTDGNKALLQHAADGRTVHLFVADGNVIDPVTNKKKKGKRQRYIGQMIVDPDTPYDRRTAPGQDGVERSVIVFHLRPDPQATFPPKFTPADAIPPATAHAVVDLDIEEELETDVEVEQSAPTGPSSSQVETEEHATDETVANIPGGQRTIQRREGRLTKAYKAHLVAAGHTVTRFQISVEGVATTLKTDLYDVTDNVLYEAKGTIRRDDVRMAIGQLFDYRRHIDAPTGLRLAVLLPGEPGKDLRALLSDLGIALVIRTDEGFDGFPLASL
ncbi:hypothetical protein ACFYNO_25065 [Kitasatospora sp. NPDC006697]|uniref:hypothetical protein n=1 Tax=Kitasatospora sp. NPDC006697 TaxID=3364020 RepID=UPI0036C87D06